MQCRHIYKSAYQYSLVRFEHSDLFKSGGVILGVKQSALNANVHREMFLDRRKCSYTHCTYKQNM